MLKSFCKTGIVKSLLECSGCPDSLKRCSSIIEGRLSSRSNVDVSESFAEEDAMKKKLAPDFDWNKLEIIDPGI